MYRVRERKITFLTWRQLWSLIDKAVVKLVGNNIRRLSDLPEILQVTRLKRYLPI
jgi:hypothetical protein